MSAPGAGGRSVGLSIRRQRSNPVLPASAPSSGSERQHAVSPEALERLEAYGRRQAARGAGRSSTIVAAGKAVDLRYRVTSVFTLHRPHTVSPRCGMPYTPNPATCPQDDTDDEGEPEPDDDEEAMLVQLREQAQPVSRQELSEGRAFFAWNQVNKTSYYPVVCTQDAPPRVSSMRSVSPPLPSLSHTRPPPAK